MTGDRSLSLLVQPDQWARCAHNNTALLPDGGVVLDWIEDVEADPADSCASPNPLHVKAAQPAGLAFDARCRAYRSWPATGKVDVYDPDTERCASPGAGAMGHPSGLAVDKAQRLYVADPSTRSVLVVDLWTQRLLRRIPLGPGRPLAVAPDCGRVAVLVRNPDSLLFLEGRRTPRPGPALVNPHRHPNMVPARITQGLLVLWRGGGFGIVASPDGTVQLEVDGALDFAVAPDGLLVVARGPGQPFRRFQPTFDGGWLEVEPAAAPGFDGGAVAVAPSGRIMFTTASGFATTAGSAARHNPQGSVVTYRMDSGSYRTRWGRVFLDACLPAGTTMTLKFLTSDSEDILDPWPATPPARGALVVAHPDQSPPLPSQSLMAAVETESTLFRRPTGHEQPWQQVPPGESFDSYEAQVNAAPGRYLWLKISLSGTAQSSPRVRAIRIERPGHQLLATLPRSWSRDDGDADFLHRYLAPLEGTLYELDWRSAERAILLDPRTTPQEALPWLATFAALVLDARWPEQARRTLIAEAYRLFARRGTRASLIRILEIYVGRAPVIIEAWQLRGLGGMVLGYPTAGPAAPAVGGNARATGMLGRFSIGGNSVAANTGAASAPTLQQDAFQLSAHRFTLLIPGHLTNEQREVVHGILDVHRPAHTMVELCELGSGMRVGQRLHVGLSSFVGPDAMWTPAVLGRFRIGGDGVVGTPATGSRLGTSSVTGQVRVG